MAKRTQSHITAPSQSSRQPDPFAQAVARLRAQRPLRNRRLQQVSVDVRSGRVESAETTIREFLLHNPADPDALLLMAQVDYQRSRLSDAVRTLARCVELAPDFALARFEYAKMLIRSHDYRAAFAEAEWS